MIRAIYFWDDFYSLDFPFDNFSLQFMDGGVWLYESAQRGRVPTAAFDRCAASVHVPELRLVATLGEGPAAARLQTLQAFCAERGVELQLASEDPEILAMAQTLGIACRQGLIAFQHDVVERMLAADTMFACMNAQGGLLEEMVAERLQHMAFQVGDREIRLTRLHGLEIEFGEEDGEGFGIYPDRVDIDKYFRIEADGVDGDGCELANVRLRVRVEAVYRMEGEFGYFTIDNLSV